MSKANRKSKGRISALNHQLRSGAPSTRKLFKDVLTNVSLHKALSTLTIHQRTVLKLSFGIDCDGERTDQEISDSLGITIKSVESIKETALHNLTAAQHGLQVVHDSIV